jgi:hypothetical protein
MTNFAKVLDGKVTQVIVAEPEFFNTFVDSYPGQWIQTSYNTRGGIYYNSQTGEPDADQSKAFRKNYAGIGYTYDNNRDAFIPPKVYNSWVLNEFSCLWEAPVPCPDDGKEYIWDESTLSWVEIQEKVK